MLSGRWFCFSCWVPRLLYDSMNWVWHYFLNPVFIVSSGLVFNVRFFSRLWTYVLGGFIFVFVTWLCLLTCEFNFPWLHTDWKAYMGSMLWVRRSMVFYVIFFLLWWGFHGLRLMFLFKGRLYKRALQTLHVGWRKCASFAKHSKQTTSWFPIICELVFSGNQVCNYIFHGVTLFSSKTYLHFCLGIMFCFSSLFVSMYMHGHWVKSWRWVTLLWESGLQNS
jgi:hypothetical protein